MTTFDCIEVLEINGRIEVLCNSEENSPAWRAYVAIKRFGSPGVPIPPQESTRLVYKEESFIAEWKMYVLDEL